MSYFTGPNLDRKIFQYDLEDLDKILAKVVSGESAWPGDYAVPADSSMLESLRIVLYSILHKYGLKELFQVKLVPSKQMLTINLKAEAAKLRTGGIHLLKEPLPPPSPKPGDVLGDEGLGSIFEEADDATRRLD